MNGREKIWQQVEKFRARYLPNREDMIPVDVFSLVELELKLDVIPFDDLSTKYKADAAIAPDFKGLYVDAESYLLWERGPIWKQNRLRFTVAHEIGHLILHNTPKFTSLDQYLNYLKTPNRDKYSHEQEANEFAGRLLVPLNRLKEFFDVFSGRIQQVIPDWRDSTDLRWKFARQIASKFTVHEDTISTRLDRERLWIAPQ